MTTTRGDQQFDELDQKLILELQADARLSFATLGNRLGVTGMTAANRLQRLRQSDMLHFRVHPNLEACGVNTEVLGLIQVDTAAMPGSIDFLQKSPEVIRTDLVTGEYDLAFAAAFPSEALLGAFVRELQAIHGVRRLVIHHQLETIKDQDGWSAVWSEQPKLEAEEVFEIAPGVDLDESLRPLVTHASLWSQAVAAGDVATLRQLSDPDIEFIVADSLPGAGTFTGFDEVTRAAQNAGAAYRKLWQRVVGVNTAPAPYTIAIDAIDTIEWTRGQVRTSLTRIAYGFVDGKVRWVSNLGRLQLPDVAEAMS